MVDFGHVDVEGVVVVFVGVLVVVSYGVGQENAPSLFIMIDY